MKYILEEPLIVKDGEEVQVVGDYAVALRGGFAVRWTKIKKRVSQ